MIASSAVTSAKINASAVTAAKLGTSAVETAKINANAVTTAKLATALDFTSITVSGLTQADVGLASYPATYPGQSSYTLPTATASALGGVKVGTRLSISAGVISADDQSYTLPTASASALGGIKVGSNLTISGGVLSATASGSSPTLHINPAGAQSIADSTPGYGTVGLHVTHTPCQLNVWLDDVNGTTDSTTRITTNHSESASINITNPFKNVETAEKYILKYHNMGPYYITYIFLTDINDSTLGNSHISQESLQGVSFISGAEGTPVRKWTISDLGRQGICQVRGRIYIDNIHIKIDANSASSGMVFACFEGGHVHTVNKVAIELGTDVYFANGIFFLMKSTLYGEHTLLELKNNLTDINLCQPIVSMRDSSCYFGAQNIYSGQFHNARFLGNSHWIHHAATLGHNSHGQSYAGVDTVNYTDVGNFWREFNYSYPVGYVALKYPAFRFEGIGNRVDWGGVDSVTTDVMRFTSVVGQTERFDGALVGVGMPNPSYSNTSHAANSGMQFDWSAPVAVGIVQTNSLATGSSPFLFNQINYPYGNNGTDLSHTNYRGHAFDGISNLPTKLFTII